MTRDIQPGDEGQIQTYFPRRGARWMRGVVLVIVCGAIALVFFQMFRQQQFDSGAKDNIPWRTNLPDALAD